MAVTAATSRSSHGRIVTAAAARRVESEASMAVSANGIKRNCPDGLPKYSLLI